jgi:hypothetical protein
MLAPLTELTSLALGTLALGGCDKVTDEGLRALAQLTGLTSLNLSRCFNVTDDGVRVLARMTGLQQVGVAVPGGADRMIHSTRAYLESHPDWACASIDCTNAFRMH